VLDAQIFEQSAELVVGRACARVAPGSFHRVRDFAVADRLAILDLGVRLAVATRPRDVGRERLMKRPEDLRATNK
jgi:hypothetical protein